MILFAYEYTPSFQDSEGSFLFAHTCKESISLLIQSRLLLF